MLNKTVYVVNLLIIASLMVFQILEIKAAWLDYDTSFGFQGVMLEQISGYSPLNVAIQPDGKILVTGYKVETLGGKNLFLRRYLSNGALDTNFGSGGEATTSQVSGFHNNYQGQNILVQADGKISVSGRANDYHAVWQFDSNGKKIKTFGQNGLRILTEYQTDFRFPDLNEQNGKLLLTFPNLGVSGEPIILIRLNANGAIDQTFGNSGESLTNLQGKVSGVYHHFGTVVESDGKITIGGKNPENSFIGQILERKLANGKTDRSFLPTVSNAYALIRPGLVKLNSGKYAMWTNNSGLTVNVVRFSANGSYESHFTYGYNGNCHIDILTQQNDGKIIFGQNGEISRINEEFEINTLETIRNCHSIQGGGVAAIQPDDKMVLVSNYYDNLLIRRLLPN